MVLFSDGAESHWNWDDHSDILTEPATVLARGLLNRLGKDHDDATVVVISEDVSEESAE
jgi:hypothetical protein